MKALPIVVVACMSFALPAVPDSTMTKLELKDLQSHPFAVVCPPGGHLRLNLRSGDFHITGHARNQIAIRLDGSNSSNAQDLTVRYRRSGDNADLRVYGGPKNHLQVTIEVPTSSMLFVRMPAGELNVEGISGDKDIELRAGDLTISIGNATDYARVDASVYTGDLEAPPFGESHGGLFRSFMKHGPGKYNLHAHVGAGDLTLR
jgi:hypothetical protein